MTLDREFHIKRIVPAQPSPSPSPRSSRKPDRGSSRAWTFRHKRQSKQQPSARMQLGSSTEANDMCNFRVGQKVVCAALGEGYADHVRWYERNGYDVELPRVGGVYTIREILIGCHGAPALRFVEMVNPVLPYHGETTEAYFRAINFRPVVERKTDIEIFRRMLNTTPETVGAA